MGMCVNASEVVGTCVDRGKVVLKWSQQGCVTVTYSI